MGLVLLPASNSMTRDRVRKPIGRTRALVYAVLVHALVIGLLVVSFRWQSSNRHAAQTMIRAHVVDDAAARLAQAKLKQQLAQQQKLAQEQKQQQQLRQQELQRQKQEQAAAKLEAAKAQKQREAAAAAAAAEKKRQAALEKQKNKEAKEAAARQQKRAIESLQQQLAEEQQQRHAAAVAAQNAAKAQSAISRYKDLIRQKVEQNWVRPLNAQKGMECVVRVRLVPGGDVIQAHVVQSSGSAVFDRSVENAVYKASPLPLPDDQTLFVYFRELEFTFKPES